MLFLKIDEINHEHETELKLLDKEATVNVLFNRFIALLSHTGLLPGLYRTFD